jgi:plasmid stabilization system protein ParE
VIYYFHPQAEREHLEVIQFYESHSKGLGTAYLREFERIMARLLEYPESFRLERQPDIRRAPLSRFPYAVVYRIVGTAVQVLAVSHQRRRPDYWVSRA